VGGKEVANGGGTGIVAGQVAKVVRALEKVGK